MKPQTLALDVYGTLINTSGVLQLLHEYLGEKASTFSELWRDKQLEYSFRRGLMNRHVDFSVCTKEALVYCCQVLEVDFTKEQQTALMNLYKVLPAFEDTLVALEKLQEAGHRLFAFSNGSYSAVKGLLKNANIIQYFDGIVSMEDVKTFKPNPAGYAYFTQVTNSEKSNAWLVSGNNFDVIGALSYGMNGVWLKRNPKATFDPMGFEPTLTIQRLTDLSKALSNFSTD